ncbi:MAG: class I SAM-dependent methyltransferase [Burkholderiaceae bacterium]|nr:class I SAM-dependent methyltransferase [Burkholderiaceae bacterium]
MTRQKPPSSVMPSIGARGLPVPGYLTAHYWWAYVHPRAVRFFERQWLVNLILWGNYGRLRSAALKELGHPINNKVLQIACAYGDITPKMVGQLRDSGSLDVIDILPVQLANLGAKLGPDERVKLHCMDSAALKFDADRFDQVLIFFLLHEQPADVREATLREAARVLKPGGTLLIVDYSKPSWYHPLRYLWKPVLRVLEPFAHDLLNRGIQHSIPSDLPLNVTLKRDFFGGLYQMIRLQRDFGAAQKADQ